MTEPRSNCFCPGSSCTLPRSVYFCPGYSLTQGSVHKCWRDVAWAFVGGEVGLALPTRARWRAELPQLPIRQRRRYEHEQGKQRLVEQVQRNHVGRGRPKVARQIGVGVDDDIRHHNGYRQANRRLRPPPQQHRREQV